MQRVRFLAVLFAFTFLWLAFTGTAAAAEIPKGTYTRKGPDGAEWTVKIDGKDKYTVTRDGKEVVEGTYKSTGDEVEFTDVKGPYAEQGDAKTGTYKWKVADKKMTLTKVKDEAKGPSGILTSGPWEMKE